MLITYLFAKLINKIDIGNTKHEKEFAYSEFICIFAV